MKITKKEIAAKLGTDEVHIGQAIDDLLSALSEEIERREAAEERTRVLELGAGQAMKYAAEQRDAAERLARLTRELRTQAPQSAVMARVKTKTRRRM